MASSLVITECLHLTARRFNYVRRSLPRALAKGRGDLFFANPGKRMRSQGSQ
jgi:hypothetical protein